MKNLIKSVVMAFGAMALVSACEAAGGSDTSSTTGTDNGGNTTGTDGVDGTTGTPAAGEYARTVMRVLAASSGITSTDWFAPVDTVVPAHTSAVADFTTFATLFVPPVGSVTTVESSAPPKPEIGRAHV